MRKVNLKDIRIDKGLIGDVIQNEYGEMGVYLEDFINTSSLLNYLGNSHGKDLMLTEAIEYLTGGELLQEEELSLEERWSKAIKSKLNNYDKDIEAVVECVIDIAQAQAISEVGEIRRINKEELRNFPEKEIKFLLDSYPESLEVLSHKNSKLEIFGQIIESEKGSSIQAIMLLTPNGNVVFYNSIPQVSEENDTSLANEMQTLKLLIEAYTRTRMLKQISDSFEERGQRVKREIQVGDRLELGLVYKYAISSFFSKRSEVREDAIIARNQDKFIVSSGEKKSKSEIENFTNSVWDSLREGEVKIIKKEPCIIGDLRVSIDVKEMKVNSKDKLELETLSERVTTGMKRWEGEPPVVYNLGSNQIFYPLQTKNEKICFASVDDIEKLITALVQGNNEALKMLPGKDTKLLEELRKQVERNLSEETEKRMIIFVNLENKGEPFIIARDKESFKRIMENEINSFETRWREYEPGKFEIKYDKSRGREGIIL